MHRSVEDRDGDIWVFWSGRNDIWAGRFRVAAATWEFTQLTATSGTEDQVPCALEDRQGNLWVFWQRQERDEHDIWYRTLIPALAPDVDEGQRQVAGQSAGSVSERLTRPGSYRVVTYHTNPAVGYGQPAASGIASRVYVNDVASPQSLDYQTTSTGTHLLKGADIITVDAGDSIQLYARKVLANNSSAGVIGEIEISIGNPLSPAVRSEG
jgi:hypothetical protein